MLHFPCPLLTHAMLWALYCGIFQLIDRHKNEYYSNNNNSKNDDDDELYKNVSIVMNGTLYNPNHCCDDGQSFGFVIHSNESIFAN